MLPLAEIRARLAARPRVPLGTWPSPVRPVSTAPGELWVKDEGAVHPLYGGNKVRKLERVFAAAGAKGLEDIVTFGAAGSHHLLAMALLGRERGLRVHGLVFPQPRTPHAEATLGASAALARLHPAGGGRLPFTLARVLLAIHRESGRWPLVVGPGASTPETVLAWAEGGLEIARSVERGELPLPRSVVVAAGSGGTAAGLWLGLRLAGLACEVRGVAVTRLPVGLSLRTLPRAAAHRLGVDRPPGPPPVLDRRWLCGGYGRWDSRVEAALALGRAEGLAMEGTYTGKALAAALSLDGPVLYVHTLSAREPVGPVPRGLQAVLG